MSTDSELITRKEVMIMIGCSFAKFKKYRAKGLLPPDQVAGGQHFYKKKSIENFVPPIDENRQYEQLRNKIENQSETSETVEKWRVNSKDTSSADVQIGLHTEKIREIEIKIKGTNVEDSKFPSIRKVLIKHVSERRRLLNYLQVSDFQRYRRAIRFIEEAKESQ